MAMKITNRLLFFRYALPCAGTLVRRGKVSQERVDELIGEVSRNKIPEQHSEDMFKVANAMCSVIAMRAEKRAVDSKVIRDYFLLEHEKVVQDRFEQMRDFNPTECRTYLGEVTKIGSGFASIRTRLGVRKYRTDFARNLKVKDKVIVHWDFIVERAPDAYLEKNEQAEPMKNETKGILLALAAAVVSGVAVPANKFFIVKLDPSVFTALRAVIIGTVFLLISGYQARAQRRKFKKVPWKYLLAIAAIGGAAAFLIYFTA